MKNQESKHATREQIFIASFCKGFGSMAFTKQNAKPFNIFARHRQRNAGLAAMRVAFSESLADSSIFRDGSFHYLVWVFGPLPALRLLPRPEDFLF